MRYTENAIEDIRTTQKLNKKLAWYKALPTNNNICNIELIKLKTSNFWITKRLKCALIKCLCNFTPDIIITHYKWPSIQKYRET